ncbi:MAG: inorganic diphosphatase [Neisseriaceae bacterium]|nr:MAG: inorganic diphosphatase [Neisseriaceae bacterium]
MNISVISPGKSFPDDFNAIVEISANSAPIKFEIDKESGAIAIDRFMGTSMTYPTNYGFVPNTLSGDGDPCDVLLVTPFPIPPGILVRCRAIGILDMEDDAGLDKKILAVPVEKQCPMYKNIRQISDLPELLIQQIQHFFEHYKDLESGKWVKIKGWGNVEDAKNELENGVKNFKK